MCTEQQHHRIWKMLNTRVSSHHQFIFITISVLYILTAPTQAVALPQEETAQTDETALKPLLPVLGINNVNANNQITNITTTTETTVENEIPEYRKNCFYAEPELCLTVNGNGNETNQTNSIQLRDNHTCHCRPHPSVVNSWYCCNITHMSMISTCSNVRNWTNLHIRNVTLNDLDLSNSIYQKLHSLAITDGNISRVIRSFSRFSPIKCLNISNNNLSDISQRALSSLPNLKFLDISKNNLSRIPKWNQNQNISVDVSVNNRMLCEPLIEAIFRDSFKFVNIETSYCTMNNSYNWFNSTENVPIKQLETAKRCQSDCPVIPGHGKCICKSDTMAFEGSHLKLHCTVDCSNMGLLELPAKLPENASFLNISNNLITSIGKHFHSNPTYQNIVRLYADNNQISSMYELEGTELMNHLQLLFLRNNALSRIPEYLLTNALDGTVGRTIYLGGNKLQCDCNSAKVLRSWLLERSRDIPDYNQILCRNLAESVVDLQENQVCQSPHDWTDYIYYLIATEVLLLLALITKVSYDYWVFKTAGYLPWPASKMPKLPCDWLCES